MTALEELRSLPTIGLGTWKISDDRCTDVVREALDLGYRHVDTAQIYENEAAVGRGLAASPVPRDDVFLATKVWIDDLAAEDVEKSVLASLDRLGVDQVDLLYVHWPAGGFELEGTLEAFQEARENGYTRYIGISNFPTDLVEQTTEVLGEAPAAHQVELHPYLQQNAIRKQARELDMAVVAYSPFRHGTILEDDVVRTIAGDLGVTPGQVVLAWHQSRDGVFPIPKTESLSHLEENFEAREVNLDSDQLQRLGALDQGDRYIDPPFAPDWNNQP